MAKQSAGILLYRRSRSELQVLLVHPGGPFWANRDEHAWSIPKGELTSGESALDTAQRELEEETGHRAPRQGGFWLSPVKQAGGKTIQAWAVEGDLDPETIVSNTFSLEWPPRSGKRTSFPEIDKAAWFGLPAARKKILKGQLPLLDELEGILRNKTEIAS